MSRRLAPVALAASFLLAACGGDRSAPQRTPIGVVPLPPAALTGDRALEAVLAARRSLREFSDRPLELGEIGQLAWAAQGVTDPDGKRTSPSAGALYPLELYVVTGSGLFRYLPSEHALEQLAEGDLRPQLHEACNGQDPVLRSPAVFVLTGVYERTTQAYDGPRACVYVHVEVGHAAQNLLLQATALGLGAVPMGGFDPGGVRRVLSLPRWEEPLYVLPTGAPRER